MSTAEFLSIMLRMKLLKFLYRCELAVLRSLAKSKIGHKVEP